MNGIRKHEELIRELSPEVAQFLSQAFTILEQENIFDAPGVISGVVRQMRLAESECIRSAAARTEHLLRTAFAAVSFQRVGA